MSFSSYYVVILSAFMPAGILNALLVKYFFHSIYLLFDGVFFILYTISRECKINMIFLFSLKSQYVRWKSTRFCKLLRIGNVVRESCSVSSMFYFYCLCALYCTYLSEPLFKCLMNTRPKNCLVIFFVLVASRLLMHML